MNKTALDRNNMSISIFSDVEYKWFRYLSDKILSGFYFHPLYINN
ncbi:hypothetical protein Phpb_03866 [Photorhabdus namnaonensis]|uniref:Uncharacterized protein n=1 Tax=Photorhabdus namnaonensis TaxID=1851568 RepID=A0A1B8YCC2_9GAMM|nr:hypothetical protein Phpb_03866 [Photorhabdus namnaonensis]